MRADGARTRTLAFSGSLKSSLHPSFRPDAIIEEQQIAAQTITPNDPALHRVRTRTLTELEMLRERGGRPDTTVTAPFPSNESVQLTEPSAELETIEISDIQSSLHLVKVCAGCYQKDRGNLRYTCLNRAI